MRIVEIFQSIDGEVNGFFQAGLTIFVRTAGCNLSCDYCDTQYAQNESNGNNWTIKQILDRVCELQIPKVTITGGEPLLQSDIYILINRLLELKYKISVETNGTIQIPKYWLEEKNISWILDYKLQYQEKMNEENYRYLLPKDWIKFVLHFPSQINEVLDIKNKMVDMSCKANFAISPVFNNNLKGKEIQQYIDGLIKLKMFDFVINLQLHKFINVK